jgi:hypothetical protein
LQFSLEGLEDLEVDEWVIGLGSVVCPFEVASWANRRWDRERGVNPDAEPNLKLLQECVAGDRGVEARGNGPI